MTLLMVTTYCRFDNQAFSNGSFDGTQVMNTNDTNIVEIFDDILSIFEHVCGVGKSYSVTLIDITGKTQDIYIYGYRTHTYIRTCKYMIFILIILRVWM